MDISQKQGSDSTTVDSKFSILFEKCFLEENKKYEELFLNSHFAIHVDAGNSDKGKTKELIPELVGWIKSCGYECEVKPDSYVASSIADKISK